MVLDANYGHPSALVEDAERAGCTLIDGREWLLGQALPAFRLFTGRADAPASQMRKALWKRRVDGRRNIALIGFAGSGKSAVAQDLASMSGMTFVDIDGRIEEKAGTSIAEIFASKGEEEFRRMEQAEIEEIGLDSNQVVSCGGGAVMNRSNVRVLRNNCLSVWLWADVKTALSRIGETSNRALHPLARPGVDRPGPPCDANTILCPHFGFSHRHEGEKRARSRRGYGVGCVESLQRLRGPSMPPLPKV